MQLINKTDIVSYESYAGLADIRHLAYLVDKSAIF